MGLDLRVRSSSIFWYQLEYVICKDYNKRVNIELSSRKQLCSTFGGIPSEPRDLLVWRVSRMLNLNSVSIKSYRAESNGVELKSLINEYFANSSIFTLEMNIKSASWLEKDKEVLKGLLVLFTFVTDIIPKICSSLCQESSDDFQA